MQALGKNAIARSGTICAALLGLAARLGRSLDGHGSASGGSALDATLVRGATVALLLVTCWAALIAGGTFLQALGSARADRALDRWCPRGVRRVALLSCGLAVASVAAVPSYAADGSRPGPGPRADARPSPLAGLPHLDRPRGAVVTPVRAGVRGTPTPVAARATLRVRTGDSLWRIVARRHPRDTDAVLARRVRALYLGNRAVIGPDADLILPGQRLRPTDVLPTDRRTRSTDILRRNRP